MASTADYGEPEAVLNERRWQIMCDVISAVQRGDRSAAHAATDRLEAEVAAEGHAGVYVWYLLRYAVAGYLRRKPTVDDLHRLAQRRYAKFADVVNADESVLEDVLLTAFNLAPLGRQLSGGKFVVFGLVAAGLFFEDPAVQLAEVKPHFADWWQRRGRQLVREGLQERRWAGGP